MHVGGEPAGFITEFENGCKLWHLGDTGVFGDLTLIADMYAPDMVLMPIDGRQFFLIPADAAMVTRAFIKAKAVIPMHEGTNPVCLARRPNPSRRWVAAAPRCWRCSLATPLSSKAWPARVAGGG